MSIVAEIASPKSLPDAITGRVDVIITATSGESLAPPFQAALFGPRAIPVVAMTVDGSTIDVYGGTSGGATGLQGLIGSGKRSPTRGRGLEPSHAGNRILVDRTGQCSGIPGVFDTRLGLGRAAGCRYRCFDRRRGRPLRRADRRASPARHLAAPPPRPPAAPPPRPPAAPPPRPPAAAPPRPPAAPPLRPPAFALPPAALRPIPPTAPPPATAPAGGDPECGDRPGPATVRRPCAGAGATRGDKRPTRRRGQSPGDWPRRRVGRLSPRVAPAPAQGRRTVAGPGRSPHSSRRQPAPSQGVARLAGSGVARRAAARRLAVSVAGQLAVAAVRQLAVARGAAGGRGGGAAGGRGGGAAKCRAGDAADQRALRAGHAPVEAPVTAPCSAPEPRPESKTPGMPRHCLFGRPVSDFLHRLVSEPRPGSRRPFPDKPIRPCRP